MSLTSPPSSPAHLRAAPQLPSAAPASSPTARRRVLPLAPTPRSSALKRHGRLPRAGGPFSSPLAPRSRARAARRARAAAPADVWGRTQYTLSATRAHASAAMRCASPRHAPPSSPVLAPTSAQPRSEEPSTADLLRRFSSAEPVNASLRPVSVEGYGRLIVHRELLDGTPTMAWTPPPAAAAAPSRAPWTSRSALVQRWLERDDDSSGDEPSTPDMYHPMVAKHLRDRSRGWRAQRPPPAVPRHDMWISTDGWRRPRGSAAAPNVRRVSTMRSLAASGMVPVMGCRCGFTDEHMDMAQCDECERWLHLACVGVSEIEQLPPVGAWACDECSERPVSAPRGGAAAARYSGSAADWRAHAYAPMATLSLAPSPRRSFDEAWWATDTSDSRYASSEAMPSSSPARSLRTGAWRTPSPPPFSDAITPSRHFTSASHAEWLPTPGGMFAPTPQSMYDTPGGRARGMAAAPDSPTFSTRALRRAGGATTPSSTPFLRADESDAWGPSSPMPATPTWSERGGAVPWWPGSTPTRKRGVMTPGGAVPPALRALDDAM